MRFTSIIKKNKYFKYSLIALVIVLVDLLTKFIFQNKNVMIIPKILSIKYSENPGLIFGLFSYNILFTILLPIIVIIAISYCCYKEELNALGATLIVAGLLGNLIDRIIRGYVIDWIFVMIYPRYNISLFNIADASLVIGIIISVYYIIKKD